MARTRSYRTLLKIFDVILRAMGRHQCLKQETDTFAFLRDYSAHYMKNGLEESKTGKDSIRLFRRLGIATLPKS